MIKSDFYLILKTLFVLVILTFLSHLFGYVLKRHDKKAKVNFNIYYVADWTTNNYNPHIVSYLKKKRQSGNGIWSVNKKKQEIFFFKNHPKIKAERLVPDLFLF